jgi:phosphatidylinositol alpha-mannosyltransferase
VNEMLDRERFDIIHFHEPFVPFLSLQILRHSSAVNIATFHAYSGFSPSYEFGRRMMGRFARRLHGRIAVSAAARHFISRFFAGEYKVIPNGVDLAQFDGVPPFARWRDGIPNILFVGRFESRKGLMYLLRAYYQLRLEGLGCRLLVVGNGPQSGEVRRYISSRRLGGVELLGRLSDHDKARAFATADIYASPATGQESFGIVLLEAMAAGVPIVCSDIHGYKGVVRRNEQAVLVPPRDVDGLAAALGTLLRDPLLRERMGTSGRRRAEQFSWEAVTARVEDYYGFVVRRLAAADALPSGFRAPIPGPPARPSQAPLLWSGSSSARRPVEDGKALGQAEEPAAAVADETFGTVPSRGGHP